MVWTQLARLPLTRAWLYTPNTDGVWFRFSQEAPPYDVRFEVAQSDGESFWTEPDMVLSGYEKRLIYLPCPAVMSSPRKLGIRVETSQPVLRDWTLSIEVSDQEMPINNPVSVSVTTPVATAVAAVTVTAATASTELVAAASSRKGLTVFNNSTARLYLDHDAAVTVSDFTVFLEPGGFYEVPREYAALQLSGIWAAANGNALVRSFS